MSVKDKQKVDKKKEKTEIVANEELSASKTLAVKYRPVNLQSLVGQPVASKVIAGMVKSGKIPGAILLEGATGSGKTTAARIIARYLNCEHRTACGKCDSCRMISSKTHPDVQELNMGVSGKVDDVRSLVRSAQSSPLYRKRVICLDEAHALTGAAANALLVPLEEPSASTLWILCTTNPEKLLDTILNRAVRITMKPIEPKTIIKRLAYIAMKEGVDLEKEKYGEQALKLIVDFTNGSMREAISLLETMLYAVKGGAEFSNKEVLTSYLSSSDVDLDELAIKLLAALLKEDLESVIRFTKQCGDRSRGLVSKLRWLLDFVISDSVQAAKFKTYAGRKFYELAKRANIEYSLPQLIRLQDVLVVTELRMNSCSINEMILLQSALGNFLVQEVMGPDSMRKNKK
jgi:DNA polymerase III subunit gamma/tau